jgi:hypothetical protein
MITTRIKKNVIFVLLTIFILALLTFACGAVLPDAENTTITEEMATEELLEKNNQQSPSDNASISTIEEVALIESGQATDEPPETTRSNPVAVGAEGKIENMIFVVKGITRPATDIVMGADEAVTQPEAGLEFMAGASETMGPPTGQEYVMVELEITCDGTFDQRCALDTFNFKLVGIKGIVSNIEWGLGDIPDLIENTEFFGGTVISGNVLFIIDEDETDLVLFYDPRFDFPLFLAVP